MFKLKAADSVTAKFVLSSVKHPDMAYAEDLNGDGSGSTITLYQRAPVKRGR